MRLLLLLRHAVTEHTGARLSGWMPGLHLSEEGRRQADGVAGRLGPVPLDAVYASPLERCQETAAVVAEAKGLKLQTLEDVIEVRYGDWAGAAAKGGAQGAAGEGGAGPPGGGTVPRRRVDLRDAGQVGAGDRAAARGPPLPDGGRVQTRPRQQGDHLPLPGDAPRPCPAPGGP